MTDVLFSTPSGSSERRASEQMDPEQMVAARSNANGSSSGVSKSYAFQTSPQYLPMQTSGCRPCRQVSNNASSQWLLPICHTPYVTHPFADVTFVFESLSAAPSEQTVSRIAQSQWGKSQRGRCRDGGATNGLSSIPRGAIRPGTVP